MMKEIILVQGVVEYNCNATQTKKMITAPIAIIV
jgi:hypothetical protein